MELIIWLASFISVIVIIIGIFFIYVNKKLLQYQEEIFECSENVKIRINEKIKLSFNMFQEARVLVYNDENVFNELEVIWEKIKDAADIYESVTFLKRITNKEKEIIDLEKYYQSLRNNIPYRIARDNAISKDYNNKEYIEVYNMAVDIYNDYLQMKRNKIIVNWFGYKPYELVDNINVEIELD